MDADERIRRFAAGHHGLVDRDTARRLGLTDRQIRIRVASGVWTKLSVRVFALAGVPRTKEQRILAAAWQVDGYSSFASSGWLFGITDHAPDRPHITTTRTGGHHHPGAVVHRTRDLERVDTTVVKGIPSTAVERTIIDLAAVLPARELTLSVDRALRLGLTRRDRLIGRFVALARPGRPGSAAARQLFTSMEQDLALVESDLESLLDSIIVDAGLPAPTRQHRVRIDGRDYRIDLSYPDALLAIEGDGFGVHGGRDAFEDDRERQNDIVLSGWRILRFTWRQICSRPDWVTGQIRRALADTPGTG
jgi:very-short-patch-repair endonuclease